MIKKFFYRSFTAFSPETGCFIVMLHEGNITINTLNVKAK